MMPSLSRSRTRRWLRGAVRRAPDWRWPRRATELLLWSARHGSAAADAAPARSPAAGATGRRTEWARVGYSATRLGPTDLREIDASAPTARPRCGTDDLQSMTDTNRRAEVVAGRAALPRVGATPIVAPVDSCGHGDARTVACPLCLHDCHPRPNLGGMDTPTQPTALVVGATGIAGSALVPPARRRGLARPRPVPPRPRATYPASRRVQPTSPTPTACSDALADARPTHVFFTAWARQDDRGREHPGQRRAWSATCSPRCARRAPCSTSR